MTMKNCQIMKKSVIHETSDIALFEHASSNAEAKTLFFQKKVHFSKNGPSVFSRLRLCARTFRDILNIHVHP